MPRGYKSFEQSPPFFVNDGTGLHLPCEKKTTPLPTSAERTAEGAALARESPVEARSDVGTTSRPSLTANASYANDPARTTKTADDLFWPEDFLRARPSR